MPAKTKPKKAAAREEAWPEPIKDIWLRNAGQMALGMRNFRIEIRRGKYRGNLDLDALCTGFTWSDTGPLLSGSITLQLPRNQKVLDIQHGDLAICFVSANPRGEKGKGWSEVWRMRVNSLEYSAAEGSMNIGLVDELQRLQQSESDFKFAKDKRHPKGWYCHQIAAEICDEYNIQVGKLMKGKKKIRRLTKQKVSPLDIIQAAYAREKKANGTKAVIKMQGGKLYILPLHYSKFLYEFAGSVTGANIIQRNRKEFATVLEVSATNTSDKTKKSKISLRVKSKKLLARFGLIVKQLKLGDVDSIEDARKEAKRWLVEHAEPRRDLTISHPGIPSVGRGDAVKIRMPREGFKKEVLFVKEATHNVAPGAYDMELTMTYDDPVANAKKEKECREKCEKARKNNRPLPKDCDCPKADRKQPEKNKDRQNNNRNDQNTKRRGGTP